MITAERDTQTGLVTLTRLDGPEVRTIVLNAEMSAGITPAHSLEAVWHSAELVPALAAHSEAIVVGRA